MYFLATSRGGIFITWMKASPFFPVAVDNARETDAARPIDFVSLIENWLITNDDARKANFRVYYYRSSKHLKQIKRASRPGE